MLRCEPECVPLKMSASQLFLALTCCTSWRRQWESQTWGSKLLPWWGFAVAFSIVAKAQPLTYRWEEGCVGRNQREGSVAPPLVLGILSTIFTWKVEIIFNCLVRLIFQYMEILNLIYRWAAVCSWQLHLACEGVSLWWSRTWCLFPRRWFFFMIFMLEIPQGWGAVSPATFSNLLISWYFPSPLPLKTSLWSSTRTPASCLFQLSLALMKFFSSCRTMLQSLTWDGCQCGVVLSHSTLVMSRFLRRDLSANWHLFENSICVCHL